jgi:hypothetical protein
MKYTFVVVVFFHYHLPHKILPNSELNKRHNIDLNKSRSRDQIKKKEFINKIFRDKTEKLTIYAHKHVVIETKLKILFFTQNGY